MRRLCRRFNKSWAANNSPACIFVNAISRIFRRTAMLTRQQRGVPLRRDASMRPIISMLEELISFEND
jgi:hypothetical protein